jgi:hypothetical protein
MAWSNNRESYIAGEMIYIEIVISKLDLGVKFPDYVLSFSQIHFKSMSLFFNEFAKRDLLFFRYKCLCCHLFSQINVLKTLKHGVNQYGFSKIIC